MGDWFSLLSCYNNHILSMCIGDRRIINVNGSEGVITNGSKIYVPENTAAFIFSESAIEEIITEPGGYEYRHG